MKSSIKTHIISLFLFAGLLLVDQITKYFAVFFLKDDNAIAIIPKVLYLQYLENKGAAWGILQNKTYLFAIITVLIISAIVFFYIKISKESKFAFLRFTIIMLAAGAIGNFIDRMINHYVVDFIYFKIINFPIFNVADIYVTISALLLLYCITIRYKEEDFSWKKK